MFVILAFLVPVIIIVYVHPVSPWQQRCWWTPHQWGRALTFSTKANKPNSRFPRKPALRLQPPEAFLSQFLDAALSPWSYVGGLWEGGGDIILRLQHFENALEPSLLDTEVMLHTRKIKQKMLVSRHLSLAHSDVHSLSFKVSRLDFLIQSSATVWFQ